MGGMPQGVADNIVPLVLGAIAVAPGAALRYAGFSNFGLGDVFGDKGGRFAPKTTSGFANGCGPFHGTMGIVVVLLWCDMRGNDIGQSASVAHSPPKSTFGREPTVG